MSNKDKLLSALECAEAYCSEVELGYDSGSGIGFLVIMKPEIMIQGYSVQLFDVIRGVDCQFSIDLSDRDVEYDDVEDEFVVSAHGGIYTFQFR